MRAGIGASISVCLLLCGGCGSPPPVGRWEGERNLAVASDTPFYIANSLRRVSLTIDEGGAAALVDGGVPYEGQVHRDGDRLVLEVTAALGKNIEKHPAEAPRRFAFDVRGKALVLDGARLEPVGR